MKSKAAVTAMRLRKCMDLHFSFGKEKVLLSVCGA